MKPHKNRVFEALSIIQEDIEIPPPLPAIEIHPPSDTEEPPIDPAIERVGPVANSHPIYIDNLGCHDFDFDPEFWNRPKRPSRTQKFITSIHRLSSRMSSQNMASENMASEPTDQDCQDSSASESSLSKRVSNLLRPTASGSPKPDLKPGDFIFDQPMPIDEAAMLAVSPKPFELKPDKLPADDKKALEARLNFHLCELDHLKKYINMVNDTLGQHQSRAHMVTGRAGPHEEKTLTILNEYSNALRVMRNVTKPFIQFHRGEIDRIAQIRVQMNIDAGLGPKIPQIFKNLSNDYEWAEMFLL